MWLPGLHRLMRPDLQCWLICDPMDHSLQAPLSLGIPDKTTEATFLLLGDLHDPGMEPRSPASQALTL